MRKREKMSGHSDYPCGLWEFLAEEIYPNLKLAYKKKLAEDEGLGDSPADFAERVIDRYIL